jgi:uncharacterized cofD-like protein
MRTLRSLVKWMVPGMGVKRWLFLFLLGLASFTIGIVMYVKWGWSMWLEYHVIGPLFALTGGYLPKPSMYQLMALVGLVLMVVGIRQWFSTIYGVVVPYNARRLVDMMYERRALAHRSSLVAVGGGTGLAALLRGLKSFTSNITAVVTVSDDGGSSGRLRKDLGLLPPGDIRNCLVALADDDTLLSDLFQYRFNEGGDLSGHSFGNLFLAALTDVAGDFDKAVKLSSKILAIRGKVLPGTLGHTSLCAEFVDGTTVEGESEIPKQLKKIKRVWLNPPDCEPLDEVLKEIAEAHAIILGPGSLFTSVIPNLLVRNVVDALAAAPGLRIYVCNVMTQPGETDGFSAADHLKAIFKHTGGKRIVDVALVNQEVPRLLLERYVAEGAFPVEADLAEIERLGVRPVATNLISETDLVRHDPQRLAEAIRKLLDEQMERGESLPPAVKPGLWSRYAGRVGRRVEKLAAAPEEAQL